MTEAKRKRRKFPSIALFLLFVFVLIFFAAEIKDAILYGIKLSVSSIIPALFPFMIFSDFLTSRMLVSTDSVASRAFEKIFAISGNGLTAFVCGTVCGFPLGIKCAGELYKSGAITKEEYERLTCFVNNPSLAFCVSAVGLGMRGSISDGLILYFAVIASAVAVGLLTRRKRCKNKFPNFIPEQKFVLSESIRNAAYSSITISSYIIFFSAIIGTAGSLIKSDLILSLLSPFFEVGSAASIICTKARFPYAFSMMLTAFSLGFSGMSVHMQAFSLMPLEFSRTRYLSMKLIQGIIASLLAFSVCLIL